MKLSQPSSRGSDHERSRTRERERDRDRGGRQRRDYKDRSTRDERVREKYDDYDRHRNRDNDRLLYAHIFFFYKTNLLLYYMEFCSLLTCSHIIKYYSK